MTATDDHRSVRRGQVAAHARGLGLDGVLVHSWHRHQVGWLTGYSPGYVTNRALLWIGADDTATLGVRFPYDLTRARSTGLAVVAGCRPTDVLPSGVSRVGIIGGDLAVDETLPEIIQGTTALGIETTDLRSFAEDLQERKLPGEIAGLARAARIGATALEVFGDGAPVDLDDFAVAARIEESCRRAGARRAVCLVGVGSGAEVTESSGIVIGRTDPVGLELTLYADEWCMHVNRQLLPAEDDADTVEAVRVCSTARGRMLAAMRVGMRVDDLIHVGDQELDRANLLPYKEYDFGHGLAADTPTHPRLVPGTGRSLSVDSVMALHVAIRVPDGPTGFVGGPVLLAARGAVELLPDSSWAAQTASGGIR